MTMGCIKQKLQSGFYPGWIYSKIFVNSDPQKKCEKFPTLRISQLSRVLGKLDLFLKMSNLIEIK